MRILFPDHLHGNGSKLSPLFVFGAGSHSRTLSDELHDGKVYEYLISVFDQRKFITQWWQQIVMECEKLILVNYLKCATNIVFLVLSFLPSSNFHMTIRRHVLIRGANEMHKFLFQIWTKRLLTNVTHQSLRLCHLSINRPRLPSQGLCHSD